MPEKKCWEKEIIDAGFKAMAKKHHPDIAGGSEEAMKGLAVARERLKFILGKFQEWERSQKAGVGSRESGVVNSEFVPVYHTRPWPVEPNPPAPPSTGISPLDSILQSVAQMFANELKDAVRPKRRKR